jgi:hypothetical protein
MSDVILTFPATGTAAINLSAPVPVSSTYRVMSVMLHLNAAPTTSENFTVTLNSHHGAVYDTLQYTLDLSAAAVVDLVWQPDEEVELVGGDALDVAYTNTDVRTYGLVITMKAV